MGNEQKIIDELDNGTECEVHFKNTEDEKTEAKKTEDEEKKASEELEKALNAVVEFGKHTFSSLTEGDCSVFFSSASYLAANKKAWAMAHKLECVLDGKTSCSNPPCPTVKAATLTAAVNGADCSASLAPAPAPAPALPPADPCKKWKEERKANLEIAAALKANVGFAPNVVTLNDDGKKTLTEVAKTLNKYPWMAVNVQAHSSAPVGDACNKLVSGRAESTKAFLAQMGVKNKMTVIKGTCTVKRAITIGAQDSIQNGAGAGSPPAGCKA